MWSVIYFYQWAIKHECTVEAVYGHFDSLGVNSSTYLA